MAQYASAKRLAIPDGSAGFAIGASEVLIHVRGEMLTRLDGLMASWGSVSMKPELKRFRGKATDKSFGDGPRRMLLPPSLVVRSTTAPPPAERRPARG